MSVAVNPCYRDDAFQALARCLGVGVETRDVLAKVLDFDIDFCEGYDLPGGLKPGNVKAQLDDGIKLLSALYCGPPVKVNHSFLKTFDSNTHVYFGLPAVHRVFHHLVNKSKGIQLASDLEFAQKTFLMGTILGQHTPKDVLARGPEFEAVWRQGGQRLFEMFTHWIRLATHYKNYSYRYECRFAKNEDREMPAVEDPAVVKLGFSKVYCFQGLVVVYLGLNCYILHRKDTERLERLVKGFALSNFYVKTYSLMTPLQREQVYASYVMVTDLLLNCLKVSNMKSAQLICRSFDVAYYTLLAHHACDIDDLSLREQRDKAVRENLNSIVNIDRIVSAVRALPLRDAIEVLQVYKILPQPDFDQYSATYKQEKLYAKQNKITNRPLWKQVMRHHKLLMIKAYHSRHKMCPGVVELPEAETNPYWTRHYPHVDPNNISPADTDFINFKGQFVYMDHMLDVFDMVKDKSICPVYIDNVKNIKQMARLPAETKNQLLDIISRPEPVSVAYLRDNIDNLFLDVKTEDKAEAKKPDGRWFMEAHSDARLVLSEYEMSVANYGSHLEGFMQGKGLIEKQKMMNHVSEATDVSMGVTQLFISFDIAKWSPRMPIEVHTELDSQWSEAFGMPHLNKMHKIFSEGTMHYVKGNIHHRLKKQGSDFEGFAGRKLTMFHLAVMHAVVDELRAKKLILGSARYAAQIDDGVLRVNVRTENLQETVLKLRKEISELWLACGIEISWDKTFMSTNFSMFLNEIRFQGRSIGCGMRAIVKVTNNSDAPVQSILTDVQMAESTIRGAIVAGAPPVLTYYLFSYLVIDTIKKWAKKDLKLIDRHLPWIFAPVNLGGLGMSNVLSLMGSLEQDSFQVGLSNLKWMAHRFPKYAPYCQRIIEQDIAEISPQQSVTNPAIVKRTGRIFRVDRLLNAMRNAMVYWLNKPTMHAYGFVRGVAVSELLAEGIAERQDIPVEVRELWYASTMKAAVDAIVMKVLTAKTAFNLVPRKLLFRLSLANLNEARLVIQSW